MIDVEQEAGQISDNMAGKENDLNHVLATPVGSEHEIPIFFSRVTLVCLKYSQYSMKTATIS